MGASLDFDGTNDYINIGNFTELDGSTEFTIISQANINNSAPSGNDAILSAESNGGINGGFMFCLYRSNPLIFLSLPYNNVNEAFIKTSGLISSDNIWYNLAWTWDASVSNQLLGGSKFYQNGNSVTLVDHVAGTNTINSFLGTSKDYLIGSRFNLGDTWDGQIAYLRIYNRALSQDEIKESIKNPEAIVNGLVGYWPLWTIGAKDLSGNGYDGTIVGTVTASDSGPPVYFPDLKTN